MSWNVFQKDVLDALEGYRHFFYRFKRMEDLEVGKRVEAVAVIKRETKHEVWIIDAKYKPMDAINAGDIDRMGAYEKSIRKNPSQIGLGKEEFYKYKLFKIFVYQGPGDTVVENQTLYIPFEKLHAFCEKNLIIPNSDYVVQHVSKLASKGLLSDIQVSLLYSGLKPYEEIRRGVVAKLHNLSESLANALLAFPPFDKSILPKGTPEISALLWHNGRDVMFPIIIPYSMETINESSQRMDLVFKKLSRRGKTIPIVVDSFSEFPLTDTSSGERMSASRAFSYFEEKMPEHVIHKDLLQWYMLKELKVIPIDEILPYLMFRNIEMAVTRGKGLVQMRDIHDFGFYFSLDTKDDINFVVYFSFPFDLDEESEERVRKNFKVAKVNGNTTLLQELKVMLQSKFYENYRGVYDLRVEIEPLHDFHALSFYGQQIMEPEITFLGGLVERWLVQKVGIKREPII